MENIYATKKLWKFNEKELYTIEQLEKAVETSNTTRLDVNISDEIAENLQNIADFNNTTLESVFMMITVTKLMDIAKDEYKEHDLYPNIIDMYDFYMLEELIDTNITYLVVTDGEPVVLTPKDAYDEMIKLTEKV